LSEQSFWQGLRKSKATVSPPKVNNAISVFDATVNIDNHAEDLLLIFWLMQFQLNYRLLLRQLTKKCYRPENVELRTGTFRPRQGNTVTFDFGLEYATDRFCNTYPFF
jgi:hypothetical protein